MFKTRMLLINEWTKRTRWKNNHKQENQHVRRICRKRVLDEWMKWIRERDTFLSLHINSLWIITWSHTHRIAFYKDGSKSLWRWKYRWQQSLMSITMWLWLIDDLFYSFYGRCVALSSFCHNSKIKQHKHTEHHNFKLVLGNIGCIKCAIVAMHW